MMKKRWTCLVVIPILLCSFAWAAEPPQGGEPPVGGVSLASVSKIKVGTSTAEQVKELLGTPFRMTNYGDCNPVDYQEIWEYLGHDADGTFKIHIEFDEAHIARIVAKDTKKGPIVVLAAAPKPEAQHQH
jgi:outer membrane protein assembly factor BamE (lipoprotein component of BamABCDE complex)